jgi:DNA replication and repair protein RecF
LYLKQLQLLFYKNIIDTSFEFDQKINGFVGQNGIGKTNVLDAIYHLAHGKSYFNPISNQNITHNEDFFMIDGRFEIDENAEQIVCSLKRHQKKVLKRNGKIYDKLSDHVGLIPLVIISPADSDLISEGSDIRRKFVDGIISNNNKPYLNQLIKYHQIVAQRNALLKYFALNRTFDGTTLEVYNEQLHDLGQNLFELRKSFMAEFLPIFQKYYQVISSGHEQVNINYASDLDEELLINLLKINLNKDKILQYTSKGIHKDDLLFEIDGHPVKKFGSQGQQKSFLIALKLAQFSFLNQQSQKKPILLFDDIFDKLDEYRVQKIIQMVNDDTFGQIFITDTHAERTEMIIKQTNQTHKIFKL